MLGAPASGKGTIAKMIQESFQSNHIKPALISSGDCIRFFIEEKYQKHQKHQQQQQHEDLLKQGSLFPSSFVLSILKDRLLKEPSFILDGFPRTVEQAQLLDGLIGDYTVIHLSIPEEILKERVGDRFVHLASGRTYSSTYKKPLLQGVDDVTGEPLHKRSDDSSATWRRRMGIWAQNEPSLLKYYSDKGIPLIRAKGTDSKSLFESLSTAA